MAFFMLKHFNFNEMIFDFLSFVVALAFLFSTCNNNLHDEASGYQDFKNFAFNPLTRNNVSDKVVKALNGNTASSGNLGVFIFNNLSDAVWAGTFGGIFFMSRFRFKFI